MVQGQPTLSDVLEAVREIHGDVKVALDRTVTQERSIAALSSTVQGHDRDIAGVKGQATLLGMVAASGVAIVVEGVKSIFGPHSGT